MDKMLGHKNRRNCIYGCCPDYVGRDWDKKLKRINRRKEKRQWRKDWL